ncbi:probable methyltransferase-like protein 25 isoform X2 [Prorops nasuta]
MEKDIAIFNNEDGINKLLEQNKFIEATKTFSLSSCSKVVKLADVSQMISNWFQKDQELENNADYHKIELMGDKKYYEVEIFGQIIGRLAKESSSLVIDAGAGKAYLSTYLSENYGIPVVAVDSSEICHQGAINRQKKLKKKKPFKSSLIKYVVQSIDDEMNYGNTVAFCFPDWKLNKNLLLTGLHTCGSLAHTLINAFLHKADIQIMCIVPCCYHLVNETFNKSCNFSKNARMLAQQCVDRTLTNQFFSPTLFYRAVLQVFLHSIGIKDARVGRGGPTNNFIDYAKWALLKLKIKLEQLPPVCVLEDLYNKYINLKKKFEFFQILRIHLGSVIEAAITLDRVVFLEKSKVCSKVNIVHLFDPLVSPRCYAIIAKK